MASEQKSRPMVLSDEELRTKLYDVRRKEHLSFQEILDQTERDVVVITFFRRFGCKLCRLWADELTQTGAQEIVNAGGALVGLY